MSVLRPSDARPEIQLILSCARTRLTSSYIERIGRLILPDLNWAALLAVADQAALTPLLYSNLSRVDARVPPLWLERLEKASRRNMARVIYLTRELTRVLERFESRGIRAIPYKGPVLGAQAYGDIALRQFSDLDIVLRQRDLAAAHEAMLGLDYQARFDWPREADVSSTRVPGEYTYRGDNAQSLVELHTERTMRHFPAPLDLDVVEQRLVTVSLGGPTVSTFCREDLLPILCIHDAKDFWERMAWIVDVAELIRSGGGLNWDAVFEAAQLWQAERMTLLGLSLVQRLIEAPLPTKVAERIEKDSEVAALTDTVSERLLVGLGGKWTAVQRLRYRYHLVENHKTARAYVWRLATAPAEEDWQPGLGTWSAGLQAALRPFRLLRRHGVTDSAPDRDPF